MKELADGLVYQKGRFHESNWHCLTVDLTKRRIEPIPIGPSYPWNAYHDTPPELADAAGALACIGSDFAGSAVSGVKITRQTDGAFMLNGELWTTGVRSEPKIVFAQGSAYVSTDPFIIDMVRADGLEIGVGSINALSDPNALSSRSAQPLDAAKHHTRLGPPLSGTRRVLSVDTSAATVGVGELVVESSESLPVQVDDIVTWRKTLGLKENMQHIVAGHPVLVRRGINHVPELNLDPEAPHGPDNWFVRENPRMGIGVAQYGKTVFLVSVQGRVPTSAGLRLKEFATLMIQLGSWDAVNLDGGGSAHMWTRQLGLVLPGCYDDTSTLAGCRPEPYATAVF